MLFKLNELWERFLIPIDDPGSRLFHLNIVFTLLFIGVWLWWKGGWSWLKIRQICLRKKYWWNRSTRIDYQIYFLNSVFKVFLFIPFLEISYQVSQWVIQPLLRWNGEEFLGIQPHWSYILLFTILAFIWDDFLRFFHHLLMHKVPWLWRLHKVHHSARILTPITLYRTHPLESAMATIRNSLSLGVATGLFIFIFESRFNVITLMGVNTFGFLFNLFGSNLRHSHVPISFGFLEKIFISPKQHQIHHSKNPDHYDRNFGVSLVIWDRLYGSLVYSRQVNAPLHFGLRGHYRQSLWFQLFRPFY